MKPKFMEQSEHKFVAEFDPTPSLPMVLGSKLRGAVLVIARRPENSTISKLGVGFNSQTA